MNTLQSNSTTGATQQYTSAAAIPAQGITEALQQTQTIMPVQKQQVVVSQAKKQPRITNAIRLVMTILLGVIAFFWSRHLLHEMSGKLFALPDTVETIFAVFMAFGLTMRVKAVVAKAALWLVSNRYLILISVLSIAMAAGGVRWTEQMLAQINWPSFIAPFDWCIHTLSIITVLIISIYSAWGLVRFLREHVFERQSRG